MNRDLVLMLVEETASRAADGQQEPTMVHLMLLSHTEQQKQRPPYTHTHKHTYMLGLSTVWSTNRTGPYYAKIQNARSGVFSPCDHIGN